MTEDSARHQQIQDRVEKATKGPWRLSMSGYSVKSATDEMPIVAAVPGGAGTRFFTLGHASDGEQWLENADFIAHAREDVPYLLAKVGELEAELSAVRQALKTYEEKELARGETRCYSGVSSPPQPPTGDK